MSTTHGKKANIYKWNGTATDLAAEACTAAGATAQITDAAKRILNPNCPDLVFTDDGGEQLLKIDYTKGVAYFSGNVGTVTATGTGAYILAANIIKTGYLFNWEFTTELDLAETTAFQEEWKSFIAGVASASGSVQGYFVSNNWWEDVEDTVDGTMQYFFLKLFTYDPDNDGTGDHYNAWVIFDNFKVQTANEVVKEQIGFKVNGIPSFTANV